MRVNLPTTAVEYLLPPGAALVSRTDLKGRITYVNPAFVEASGFAVEALMGKAHNIVRHPDMPPEAFADLWQTLDEGLPWTGAGEQGRGFAVVASEVRSLAQRSAAAAKEIKGLIDDSVHKVEAGSALVSEAGQTMEEIVASVRRVTDIMGEISAASHEQTQGIEQVNQAITQMDQVTQQNAALVEESAAAATALNVQAGGLVEAVYVFNLDATASKPAARGSDRRSPPGVPRISSRPTGRPAIAK